VATSQFNKTSWLFRTTFMLQTASKSKSAWLRFKGLSYRGRVYLNGVLLTPMDLVGTFVYHDVALDPSVERNAITVQLWRAVDEVRPFVQRPAHDSTPRPIP
jgi:hypothetical protein